MYGVWYLDWTNVLSISQSIESFTNVQDLNTLSNYNVAVLKLRLQGEGGGGRGLNKREQVKKNPQIVELWFFDITKQPPQEILRLL